MPSDFAFEVIFDDDQFTVTQQESLVDVNLSSIDSDYALVTIPGVKGDKGDTGNQGIQGLKGDKGDTGSQGIQGLKGDKGDTGSQGIQGIQGIQGEKGDTGSQGIQGLKGDKGDTGSQGIQGLKGDKGDTGNAGAAATISVGTVTTGAAGSSAIVTNSGTSAAAVLDFSIPRGETGAKGDTGSPGNDGAAGAAATISVGTVTTGAAGSSATVTNAGTSSAAVFNFSIPKGDKGDTGSAGTTSWLGITDIPSSLVYTDTQQTLGSKTLTAPVLTGATVVPQSGTVQFFNTVDQATNYERIGILWTSNVANVGVFYGGTGSNRNMRVGVANAAGGALARYVNFSPSTTPFFSFTPSGTGTTGQIFNITSSGLTAATGTQTALGIDPTINQSGTAGYTALLINPTETATGSGSKRLISAQVGGSDKFVVDNTGAITSGGNAVVVRVSAPASATATGTAGQIAYDSSYLYVCVATNTWKRTALSSW